MRAGQEQEKGPSEDVTPVFVGAFTGQTRCKRVTQEQKKKKKTGTLPAPLFTHSDNAVIQQQH